MIGFETEFRIAVCARVKLQLEMNSFGVTLQFCFGDEHFGANFAVDEFHLIVDPLNVEQECIFFCIVYIGRV